MIIGGKTRDFVVLTTSAYKFQKISIVFILRPKISSNNNYFPYSKIFFILIFKFRKSHTS